LLHPQAVKTKMLSSGSENLLHMTQLFSRLMTKRTVLSGTGGLAARMQSMTPGLARRYGDGDGSDLRSEAPSVHFPSGRSAQKRSWLAENPS